MPSTGSRRAPACGHTLCQFPLLLSPPLALVFSGSFSKNLPAPKSLSQVCFGKPRRHPAHSKCSANVCCIVSLSTRACFSEASNELLYTLHPSVARVTPRGASYNPCLTKGEGLPRVSARPEITAAGGWPGITSGFRACLTLDLEAGRRLLRAWPHAGLGRIAAFHNAFPSWCWSQAVPVA